jgi:hypothetical protein
MFGRLDTVEKRQEARKYYLSGFDVKEYPDLKTVIGTKTNSKPEAVAFVGTAGRPTWHYTFKTIERMEEHIKEFLESQKSRIAYKAGQKAKNKGKLSGAAACAAAIRKELKEKFPGVKFSVRSETYSGGDSVRINWADGPEHAEVAAIANSYEAGHFDGMTDMYIYHKDRNPDRPSAKYVFANKNYSDEAIRELKAKAEELFVSHQCFNNFGDFRPQLAERLIREELQRGEAEREQEQMQEKAKTMPDNVIQVDFVRRKVI